VIAVQLVWRTVKVFGELFDGADVVLNRGLGIVATLEFLQHHASEIGHRNLLVTHTLPDRSSVPHA
jgi:hypothetical protein